jgi:hypothetical protein
VFETATSDQGRHTFGRFLLFLIGFAFSLMIVGGISYGFWGRWRMRLLEETALDCIRQVRQAETGFAKANGGLFAPPLCIEHTEACPGAKNPHLAVPACLQNERANPPPSLLFYSSGYNGTFISHDGPLTLTNSFLVTLEPAVPGKTGSRAFWLDQSGRICALAAQPSIRSPLRDSSGRLRTDCEASE